MFKINVCLLWYDCWFIAARAHAKTRQTRAKRVKRRAPNLFCGQYVANLCIEGNVEMKICR